MSTTDCKSCGATLVPGLGCCAAQAAAIAAGKRKPLLAQRPVRKSTTPPHDMATAYGPGAHSNVRYAPNAQQMRVRGRDRAVGVGRDNYAMARNTTLLHTHWVPSPAAVPTVPKPDPRVQAANAKLRATVARAQAVASGNAADDKFNPAR